MKLTLQYKQARERLHEGAVRYLERGNLERYNLQLELLEDLRKQRLSSEQIINSLLTRKTK